MKKLMVDDKTNNRESSAAIGKRVKQARNRQTRRFDGIKGIFANADMKNRQIKQLAKLTAAANLLLKQAINKYALSARTYFRLIKVARTVADLDGAAEINDCHMAETLQYRIRIER